MAITVFGFLKYVLVCKRHGYQSVTVPTRPGGEKFGSGTKGLEKTHFGMQIVSSELIEFFVDDLDVRRDSLESKISPSNMLNSGNI